MAKRSLPMQVHTTTGKLRLARATLKSTALMGGDRGWRTFLSQQHWRGRIRVRVDLDAHCGVYSLSQPRPVPTLHDTGGYRTRHTGMELCQEDHHELFKAKAPFSGAIDLSPCPGVCLCSFQLPYGNHRRRSQGEGPGRVGGSRHRPGQEEWKEWKAETDWDSYSADAYKPLKAKTSRISRLFKARKATFLIFAGSWCKDSEAQLPMIMKLLEAARVPPRSIELFGVDANLKEPSGTAQRYEVANSPTLIILKGQTELGRIVERLNRRGRTASSPSSPGDGLPVDATQTCSRQAPAKAFPFMV